MGDKTKKNKNLLKIAVPFKLSTFLVERLVLGVSIISLPWLSTGKTKEVSPFYISAHSSVARKGLYRSPSSTHPKISFINPRNYIK